MTIRKNAGPDRCRILVRIGTQLMDIFFQNQLNCVYSPIMRGPFWLPGLGYVVAFLVVAGGLVFNIR